MTTRIQSITITAIDDDEAGTRDYNMATTGRLSADQAIGLLHYARLQCELTMIDDLRKTGTTETPKGGAPDSEESDAPPEG